MLFPGGKASHHVRLVIPGRLNWKTGNTNLNKKCQSLTWEWVFTGGDGGAGQRAAARRQGCVMGWGRHPRAKQERGCEEIYSWPDANSWKQLPHVLWSWACYRTSLIWSSHPVSQRQVYHSQFTDKEASTQRGGSRSHKRWIVLWDLTTSSSSRSSCFSSLWAAAFKWTSAPSLGFLRNQIDATVLKSNHLV